MLTSNLIKYITSLNQKKYRIKYNSFIVDGIKVVLELLESDYEIEYLFYTTEQPDLNLKKYNSILITEAELKKISNLSTPNQMLAICKIKPPKKIENIANKLSIVLDDINDPGNLGTIIRLADWFGIENIICSNNSVDLYNPKVIQSTKGSFLRVNLIYTSLEDFLSGYSEEIYGTYMEGEAIYEVNFSSSGLLVFGNEANGISNELEKYITKKITIPRASTKADVNSLNIAMSAAIILGEVSRK